MIYLCFMNLFQDLQFDERTHTYRLDGKKIPSKSSVISELHDEFPYDTALINTARSRKISVTELDNSWQMDKSVGIAKGKETHEVGEGLSRTHTVYDIAIQQYLHRLNFSSYNIVAKEIRMYTREYWIAGTADLLLYNIETDKYIIVDYKTNKDLFKTYGDMMYPPFDDFVVTPYNKYIIQLNGYQIMLEEAGLEVEKRIIVWVNKRTNHSIYTIYELPNIVDRLKNYYVTRRDNIKHKVTYN